MISRIWHGATARAKSDEYLDYLNRTGVPDYRAMEGNREPTSCAGPMTA